MSRCECPVAGYCNRHKRHKSPRSHAICQGTAEGLTKEQQDVYWNNWERLANGEPPKRSEPRPIAEPVGDYLKQSFAWLVGVKYGCCSSCQKLQDQMNRWGVAGCRTNYWLILEKLETHAFSLGLPLPRASFIPLLELALSRAARNAAAVSDRAKEEGSGDAEQADALANAA